MGEVWRAKHPTLDRWVAIKLIRAEAQDRPQVREAFLREVRHLSQLHAAQTLQILDFGFSEQDLPFMVTEFLEGEDLGRRIKAEGALPVEEAIFIAAEVLKSVSEAHALGIIHRDIKPANVFLQQLPSTQGAARFGVKVLDFGIAKMLQAEDTDMTLWPGMALKGSPRYMSPEQIQSSHITPAADLYAVGGLLYTMLTGRPPFEGDRDAVLQAHLHAAPPSLQARRADVSPALAALVDQCLSKDPLQRPASAEALLSALEGLRRGPQEADFDEDDEDDEDDEAANVTMQHEPEWGALDFSPHASASVPSLDALSFGSEEDSAKIKRLSAGDLFGAPMGSLAELSDLSEGGVASTGGSPFGSMSGLLSAEERQQMRPRGDEPELDPKALFVAPPSAEMPSVEAPARRQGAASPIINAMLDELQGGGLGALPPPSKPAPAPGLEIGGLDVSHLGFEASAGNANAQRSQGVVRANPSGSSERGAEAPKPKPTAIDRTSQDFDPVALMMAQPDFASRDAHSLFVMPPPREAPLPPPIDEGVDEVVASLQEDASMLQLEFEGRPPPKVPQLGEKQREAEARLGLARSREEVPEDIDDAGKAPSATPAYVRTLQRRQTSGGMQGLWIGLAVLCLVILGWMLRVPIAQTLRVNPRGELGRFLGMRPPPLPVGRGESAEEIKARLLAATGPSLLDEPEPQVDFVNKAEEVRVLVSPPARFIREEGGEVICDMVAECSLPIDVDVRVELKGYKTVHLTGDDLYDRRGGRWDLRLYPTNTAKAKPR
ncbi:serine/threonine protein kinase [Myxococcota bacterium]|nr:serine/threonine protein kinase [Myxococcota bacterium]